MGGVLVVGNLGYVGPVLMDHLVESSEGELLGFDAGFFSDGFIADQQDRMPVKCKQLYGDVRNLGGEIFEGIDSVVYLAALSNDPIGKEFESATFDINRASALNCAKLAKERGVKSFVFASSCSIYGAGGDEMRKEDAQLAPQTAYAHSKVGAEGDLKQLAGRDFTVTCLRFATACGFSPNMRLDLVVNDFVASAISIKSIKVLSDGSPWRPLIHVKDMARAIDWGISRSQDSGGAFLAVNVGRAENNFQIKDLANVVAKIMPGVNVNINQSAMPDTRSYRVDFSLFSELAPGCELTFGLPEIVDDLYANLTDIGFSDAGFRSGPMIRLNHLRRLIADGLLSSDLYWCGEQSLSAPVGRS